MFGTLYWTNSIKTRNLGLDIYEIFLVPAAASERHITYSRGRRLLLICIQSALCFPVWSFSHRQHLDFFSFHTISHCFIMRTPPHAAWEAPWMLCLRFIRTIRHDLLCFAATSVFRRWETPKPNVSTRLSYPSASRGPRRTSLQRSSSGTSMIRRSTWIRSLTYRCSGWVLTHRQEESSVLQTGSGDRKKSWQDTESHFQASSLLRKVSPLEVSVTIVLSVCRKKRAATIYPRNRLCLRRWNWWESHFMFILVLKDLEHLVDVFRAKERGRRLSVTDESQVWWRTSWRDEFSSQRRGNWEYLCCLDVSRRSFH